jgi:hypothetical protein
MKVVGRQLRAGKYLWLKAVDSQLITLHCSKLSNGLMYADSSEQVSYVITGNHSSELYKSTTSTKL